jgi:hypothetical protein
MSRTCIGKRNYKYFYTFVVSACVLCLYGVLLNLLNLVVTLFWFFYDNGFSKDAPSIAWFILTRCGPGFDFIETNPKELLGDCMP